ncbi:MAG: methyl-accepting chemotaxis protein [Treponema sp.]|jgi:methyl-accepting chemotaxis protein|nr:methyl-accepting chemotaxis protein [Treponema sp.]
MIKRNSIKFKILLFSCIFFPLILIIGSTAFFISMRRNIQISTGHELIQKLVAQRIKLESSVESEIAIVLKLANSPLIQQYFANPQNTQIARMAHNEIASYRSAFKGNTVFWVNNLDKNFWIDDSLSYVIDPSNPEDYWYNRTLYETEKYNFNINFNPALEKTNLWINAPVSNSMQRSVGIVGTGIDLTSFIDSIYEDFASRGELYFFNAFNEVTGASDISFVRDKATLTDVLGVIGDEILSIVKSESSELHTGEVKFINNKDTVAVLGHVPSLDWYIVVVLPVTTKDILNNSMTALFASMMAVILFIFAAFYLFITKLLHRTTATANRVFESLEKNDLSVKIEVMSRDELGGMLMGIDGFLDKLRSSFALFNKNSSLVSCAVNELSTSAREIAATANEQSASVAEIVSTMENNKKLSGKVSSNTFEVAELAEETKTLSEHGAELHSANEKMMLDVKDKNDRIVEEIKNLHDLLSRIDESIQIIDSIADRTKLIAFNAALEASSSGEAGLRFSVVAGEIRRFADNVVGSVFEIKERVAELQAVSDTLTAEAIVGSKAIDSGYTRMVEQKEVYESIVEVSQNVAERSHQISELSKQQEQAAEQMFSTLKEISAGIKHFVDSTVSTSATAENLNTISLGLKETLEKYQITKE